MFKGLVFDKKSPIVNLHFLSEWGEQLITPYKPYLEDAESNEFIKYYLHCF